MADTLESLEIEVKHSASGAAEELKSVSSAIRGMGRALDNVIPKLREMNSALSSGGSVSFTRNTQIADTINNVNQAASKAGRATADVARSTKEVGKAAAKANKPLSAIVKSFGRIAFYRAIRTIIKNVAAAFSEGLQYAYAFSDGIAGTGHRFAEAMDSMKSAGTQMKAQIGSAFIGLLAAVTPIVIQIINLVTKLADALSQLFAAFTGTTYLKANVVADKFADTMKKGAGSAKEWKNQLMGFDEINRLEEPSSGGGGSNTGLDPSQMFTETPIEAWAMKAREAIQWVIDHLDIVKALAEAIGVALLTWKIGNFISGLSAAAGPLGKIAGIALYVAGAFLTVRGAVDAIAHGVNWGNLTQMIGGTLLMAAGLGIAFGGVGAAVGLLVGGISMLVVGLYDWIKTGELSTQTFWLLEAGIVAVGIALVALVGWPAAIVAAVAAAALAIYKYFDQIWGWVQHTIDGIVTAILALRDFFSLKSINERAAQMEADDSMYLQGFASGGYPQTGELFLAQEQGPEMVGRIGNRTAVANNDQIVEAVSMGVANAVSAALGNGGTDRPVKIYLDGREIATTTTRYQNQIARAGSR